MTPSHDTPWSSVGHHVFGKTSVRGLSVMWTSVTPRRVKMSRTAVVTTVPAGRVNGCDSFHSSSAIVSSWRSTVPSQPAGV